MIKTSTVEFSVPVSDKEKKIAGELKAKLQDFCDHVEKFQEFLKVLTDSLNEVDSGAQLIPIGRVIVKYKYKLRDRFNNCVKSFSLVLVAYNSIYAESRTDQIRDVMMNTFSEARNEFISLLKQLDDLDADNFLADAKASSQQINKYMEKVLGSAKDEWMQHIDKNILGKLKLASLLEIVRVER